MTRKRKLHPIEGADLRAARKVAINPRSKLGKWIGRFAELGDQPPLVALSVGVAATGTLRRNERLTRTGLRMLAAHSLSTMGKLFVKDLVDRTRPRALSEKTYRLKSGDSRDGRLRSMPSGHSAGAAAAAGAIVPDYPRAIGPVVLFSAGIAAAQPPARNHYVTDVLIGAAMGVAVSWVARLLVPPQDRIEQSR